MSFLPQNYEAPAEGSRYLKLKKGENRFRVLGSAIVGNEFWVENDGKRKPVRRRVGEKISTDELELSDGNGIKHFWAFPVFDVSENSVKVFEITQKGIRKEIQKLVEDADWGDPIGYDLVIHREGDGLDTEYSVQPKPAKALSEEIKKAWKEVTDAGFDLEELFTGGDPFNPTEKTVPKKIDLNEEINIDDIPF